MYTITVTSSVDTSDTGTLRWAVAQANNYKGEDEIEIVFDEALAAQEIILSSELSLKNQVSIINLPGGNAVRISGVPMFFDSSAVVNISGTTLQNLEVRGSSTFTDNTFEGCLLLGQGDGGIHQYPGQCGPIQGSGNTFTQSGEVIRLQHAGIDMTNFHADATQDDAYIAITGGRVNSWEDVHYTALSESLSHYRLKHPVTIYEGGHLTLGENTVLESFDTYGDLIVVGTLTATGSHLQLTGHSTEQGDNLSGITIRQGGTADFRDSTITGYAATRIDTYRGEEGQFTLLVQNGGLLNINGCTLENVTAFRTNKGSHTEITRTTLQKLENYGALDLTESTVEDVITNYGELTTNGTTFNTQLVLNSGTTISGNQNTFLSSGAVITANGAIDFSDFQAEATQEDAYIGVSGYIDNGASVIYRPLGDTLNTYLMSENLYVRGELTSLSLGKGLRLILNDSSDNLNKGLMVSNGARLTAQDCEIELLGHSKDTGGALSGIHIQANSSAVLERVSISAFPATSNTTYWSDPVSYNILVASASSMEMNDCSLHNVNFFSTKKDSHTEITRTTLQRLDNSGELVMNACTIERELINKGTYTANDNTFNTQLTLKSGSTISGTNNTFLGRGAVITANGAVDFSDFRAEATQEDAYIGVSGTIDNGASVIYRPLGDTLNTYLMSENLYVRGELTSLSLGKGLRLILNDSSDNLNKGLMVSNGARLTAQDCEIELLGHSKDTGGALSGIHIQANSSAVLERVSISAFPATSNTTYWSDPVSYNILVASASSMEMNDCSLHNVNFFSTEKDSHTEITRTTLQRLDNSGELVMNACDIEGGVTLRNGTSISGRGNVFLGSGAVITADGAVDFSDFQAEATQADAYIALNGTVSENMSARYSVLGKGLNTYLLTGALQVYNKGKVYLEEGATLRATGPSSDIDLNRGASFEATGARIELLGASNGDRSQFRVYGGAELRLTDVELVGADSSFRADGSGNIRVYSGGSLIMNEVRMEGVEDIVVESGARAEVQQSGGAKQWHIGAGAAVSLHGCDLSASTIFITGSQGGENVIDLSGNYWGTSDRAAIMSRISGDISHVVLEDILLVDPTTSFIYCGNNLRNNRVALGTKELVVEFTHEIDPATVTNDSVRLVDEQGKELHVSSVAVEGKTLRLSLPELTNGESYRLVLDSSLRDIAGAAMADSTGLGYAALIRADFTAPRVSHIDPAGDFAGTLESLRLYMTETMDLDSLKAGVRLTGPNGQAVAIQRILDIGGNVYEIQIAPQTDYGQYTLSVSNTVCDLAGNRLNQNLNEVFGEVSDIFTASFHIADVDLTITHAEISGDISMGTPVTITWQGANASGYPLHGEWTDGVYLSADPRWDINDRFLGSYTHSEGLAEGATYEGSLTAQLSGVRPGEYYILIRSDINGQEQINKESAEWTQNLVAIPVQVTVPRLEVGDLQMGEMTPEDSMDYLMLHQEAGQSIRLTLHSNADAANMEIFVGYGQMPTRESYDIAWQKGASSGELILPSRTAAGDVYLLVNNKSSAVALKYTLDAEVLPMTVTAITPTTQGRESSSTFDLYGTNFTHSTRVVFVDNEGTEYRPDSTDFISDSRIRVKFGAKKLPAEKLDIIVTNEYEEQVVMDNAVTITASTGAHLKIAKVFPELLGYHIQGTLKIVFENTGSDPMHAPLLTLVGKQNGKEGAIMTMDPSIVNQGFWTSAMPEGFANSVSFLAYSASSPGWLMPSGLDAHFSWQGTYFDAMFDEAGLWWFSNRHLVHSGDGYQVSILNDPSILSKAREYVSYGAIGGRGIAISENSLAHLDYSKYLGNTAKIYYCGWQQPWDFSYPEFNFELGYLGTDNTATLNWYDSFSGTTMPEEQKRLLADALTRTAGGTWGDYVLMLNNNLIYLDELGCLPAGGSTMYDTDSLVTFELMKADGSATPAKTLAASVDMAQEAQGLSLLIARTYGSSISSRFTEGAFGYGWSFNWEMSLTFREDGTAELHAPGSSLIYQPDYRGGYINTTPKDTAVFAKQRDGSYTRTERDGTRYTFAADGKLNSVRDANGNTITCGYDENGKLCTLTHSGGEQLTLTWDEAGHISSVTNSLGDTTTYRYDRGHLVQVTDYLGDSVSYEYSDTFAHALTRVIGTDGVSEHFTYNERGLVESSALGEAGSPLANYGTITLSYGDNGEVTVTDIYGATTTYYYDNKGQVRRAVDVNGNALTYGYDDAGNLVSFTDQAGNSSAYTYDAAGNMLSSTNALGHTITYTYTEQEKLDVLTDALGHQTDYDYDARGNMTAITYADGSMETWSYDTRGNASSWVNRRGGTVRYSYDSAGRLTARRYEDGSTVTFNYDERGKLLSATDTEGTTRYSYDERERLVRIDTPQGHSLTYGYDEHDNRTSMTDEHGNSTLYAYDGFGHLTRVSDGEGRLITAYTYDQGGRLTTEDRGDGTQVLYTYDKSGQATSITTLTAAGETLSFIRYEYDKTGLRTAMHTQDGSWRYTYDKVGQLTRAVFSPAAGSTLAAQDLRYEYDAAGNRTRSVVNGQETLYTVNALNQTTAAGDIAYQYDADGNMISRTDAEGTTLYTWDAENRLIGVQTAAGDVYAYTYNSAGDRVAETHNGITTQYLYDPAGYGNLTAVYDAASGEQSRTYTHGNGLIGFEDALAGRYWYQGDALGSVTGITDGSGNLIATYSYDPFGTTLSATGSIDNPFLWTGLWGLSTEQTGLLSMRARSYDTTTGKFTSADPIGINGGVNLYAYCGNNILNFIDPSGLEVEISTYLHNTNDLIYLKDRFRDGCEIAQQEHIRAAKYTPAQIKKYGGWTAEGRKIADIKKGARLDTMQYLLEKAVDQQFDRLKNYRIENGYYNAADEWLDDHPGFLEIDGTKLGTILRWDAGLLLETLRSAARIVSLTLSSDASDNVNSHDPNDLVGPKGYGTGNFIAPGMEMRFMLRFENEAEATAPTHWMRAFTTFDEAYDLDSFTLNSLYVAGNMIELTEGRDSFNQKVVLTVDGKEVLTEIAVNLDRETRELKAEFTALDPQTGLMLQDPEKGMLYPNDETGRGDAFITYTITSKQELTTGTTIHNAADIYFDFNDVIPTPEIDYTIDADAAQAELLSAEAQGNGTIRLTWTGEDAEGGSGFGGVGIYVSKDGGDLELWQVFTSELTSVDYIGEAGHDYGFAVVGYDNVGNAEKVKTEAELFATALSGERIETATSITLTQTDALAGGTTTNSERLVASVGYGDLADFYTFTAAADGTYAVALDMLAWEGISLSVGTADEFDVFHPQKERLLFMGDAHNAIEGINLRKGETAYIRVGAMEGAVSTDYYELRVAGEVPAAASITDNNTAETADRLVSSPAPAAVQGWVGAGDACDFYRLQLAEASSLQLTLSGVDTAARVKVYAEQSDGSTALISAGTATAAAGLDRTLALTSGSYFIEVASLNPDNGLSNSVYTLELKEQKGKQSSHYVLAAR